MSCFLCPSLLSKIYQLQIANSRGSGALCLYVSVNLRQASYRNMVCTGNWWGWGSGGGERLGGRLMSESAVRLVSALGAGAGDAVDAGVVLSVCLTDNR